MQIEFHSFLLGDVDVDVYVAEPIWQWQQTEIGQWAMEHARNLRYLSGPDENGFMGYKVRIVGEVDEGPRLTEYLLRWHNRKKES